MKHLQHFVVAVAFLCLSIPAGADRILERKDARKLEVRNSMLGFRNTLLFYAFPEQQAILTLSIGNKDASFPVRGRVFLFDAGTTNEGLEKWINNQHSDGLFPDIPEPKATVELPRETCRIAEHKRIGQSKNAVGGALFTNYEVKISVGKFTLENKFKLSGFTDTARVHVKSK